MKIEFAFSTCPNDTFMFDAMINNKVDTEGIKFTPIYADIAQLNQWSLDIKYDLTKISYNAFTFCTANYSLLDSGSALGYNCGPILIKKPEKILNKNSKIGIPGIYTTANMLMNIAFPEYNNKEEIIFSDIEQQLLDNKIDAGLIIHESRFSYIDKGLVKVRDLGEYWQEVVGLPIPLGGIVVNKQFSKEMYYKIDRILKRSIQYAFNNPQSSMSYILSHAQEMDKEIISNHIKLYVNDFSFSLKKEGREAVKKIFTLRGKAVPDLFK
tara:strand:- start:957 stop:1760 length:804 start_codon:yes stop_codon:yes gene_type:complete